MTNEIVPPIITSDDGDIEVFDSVASACSYLEAVDVRDGVYEVFDSVGHKLDAVAFGEQVEVTGSKDEGDHSERLLAMLRTYVARVRPQRLELVDLRAATLAETVSVIYQFQRG